MTGVSERLLGRGNTHTCRTCKHWQKAYPQNQGLGLCGQIHLIDFTTVVRSAPHTPAIALGPHDVWDTSAPLQEFAVRTVADFGCVCWDRELEAV